MGLLNTILDKILPGRVASAQSSTPSGAPTPMAPSATPVQAVDIRTQLTQMSKDSSQKLNWETSIVDLMKLVGVDSSLENRKALAKELNYTGDTSDSAAMNIWLHKQVMKKLSENGGKVPSELLH